MEAYFFINSIDFQIALRYTLYVILKYALLNSLLFYDKPFRQAAKQSFKRNRVQNGMCMKVVAFC